MTTSKSIPAVSFQTARTRASAKSNSMRTRPMQERALNKRGEQYSNTLGGHTFPLPKLTEQNRADPARYAENILLVLKAHFPATIADLNDPEAMPADLRRPHDENDEVLERIYIGHRFCNGTERLEKLFERYIKMAGKKAAA